MNTVLSIFGLSPLRIGGAERYARELSHQLCRHGWNSVLCYQSEPPEEVRRYLELPNVAIEVLRDSWALKWQPSWDLARILRRHRPRVMHLHYTGLLGLLPWVARTHGVEKVFFSDRGSRPAGYRPGRAPLWKRAAARAIGLPLAGVVCVSEYNRRSLLAEDILPAGRIHKIYNGVPTTGQATLPGAGASFRLRFGIHPSRPLVIQVSSLTPGKGIPDFLEAARLILDGNPETHFAVVGDGPLRGDFERLAAQLGLTAHVTFTGLLKNPVAEGAYAASDVVCLLSSYEEAFGFVVAEAMAEGRPVVATRSGGIPELVADGTTGYLVERGDARAAADRVLHLIRSEVTRRSMGSAGREVASVRFDIRRNVSYLMRLYGIQQHVTLPDGVSACSWGAAPDVQS